MPAWEALLEAGAGARRDVRRPATRPRRRRPGWRRCREVLDRYFTLEDPRRLEPAERELYVETLLDSKLLLRGFVDRLDVAPDGAIRVVDYKTGTRPGEAFEAKALFQMKFYALVIWRTRGVVPAMLQLIYLGNGEMLRYVPDEDDLLATERKVEAIWQAIRRAAGDRRLAAEPVRAVRLVRPPGALPGVRRHAAAAPGAPTPDDTDSAADAGSRREDVDGVPVPGPPPARWRHSGVTSCGVISPEAISSAQWQATRCAGASDLPRARGARCRTASPGGTGTGCGSGSRSAGWPATAGRPASRIRSRVSSTAGSGTGTADIRARV